MSPAGYTMLRIYLWTSLACLGALVVERCKTAPLQPHAVPLSTAGVAPSTTELGARIDLLELRMESRDDAIETLLWLAEQDRKDGCR